MNQFLQQYHQSTGRRLLILLSLQIPVFAGVAAYFGTGVVTSIVLGIGILSGPLLISALRPASKTALMSIGIGSMCMSALLIHHGRGMIEMHFHVFVMLAILIVMASPLVIITAAATIAVHHIAFFLWLPSSVFNYEASFGIVLVHAVFVIVESIPAALVARKFQQFIRAQGTISSLMRDVLSDATQQVAVLATASQDQADGACSQAASLEETSASLNEIAATITRNSESADIAKKLTSHARREADDSAADTVELNQSMSDIKAAGDNIARVIKAIDEIAFQTNILALNAAVEAARAGEAGMGFGVVAEEVRNLAQRSAAASRETSELINDAIQKSERGSAVGIRVAERLQSIGTKTHEVDEIVVDIANASKEHSEGIQHVTSAIQQIEHVTQNSSASAEESASVAATVKGHIVKLGQALDDVMLLVGATDKLPNGDSPDSQDSGDSRQVSRKAHHTAVAASTRSGGEKRTSENDEEKLLTF